MVILSFPVLEFILVVLDLKCSYYPFGKSAINSVFLSMQIQRITSGSNISSLTLGTDNAIPHFKVVKIFVN